MDCELPGSEHITDPRIGAQQRLYSRMCIETDRHTQMAIMKTIIVFNHQHDSYSISMLNSYSLLLLLVGCNNGTYMLSLQNL